MKKACYLIAGNQSGAGKTSITSALALFYQSQKKSVRLFKLGPDFLDTQFHQSLGFKCTNLDPWMMEDAHCIGELSKAYQTFDIILIESAMGLLDGRYNAFDCATSWGLDILLVVSAKGLAQTLVAQTHGLCHFKNIPIKGIVVNRIQSDRHQQLIEQAFGETNLPYLGAIVESKQQIKTTHLGIASTETKDFLNEYIHCIQAMNLTALHSPIPKRFKFLPALSPQQTTYANLSNTCIAMAHDRCFSFIYEQNIEFLQSSGARIIKFSPTCGDDLPVCDSVYLPGGYPEFFIQPLQKNHQLQASLKKHVHQGKKVYAECGGMMLLCESLQVDKKIHPFYRLLPAKVILHQKRQALGMYQLQVEKEVIRGHSFHYSTIDTQLKPFLHVKGAWGLNHQEPVYKYGSITATYFHAFWRSAPKWITHLFRKII